MKGARVLVWLMALVVTLPVLRAGPVYDDHALVEENRLAHAPVDLRAIFTTGYWHGSGLREGNEYRPLTVLSFALVDHLGSVGQRAVNGLLHALVAVMAMEVTAALTHSRRLALSTGLLFALHPVHAEVLGTLVGRGELLATTLVLGAWRAHRANRGAVAAVLAAAAFLAKENAIALPALVLLADWLDGGVRRRSGATLWLGLGLASAMLLRVRVIGGILATEAIASGDNPLAGLPATDRVLSALASFGTAARLALLPVGLLPDRAANALVVHDFGDPRWLAGPALAAGGLYALVRALRGSRAAAPVALGLGIFGITYVPVSNLFFPVGTALAERLLYVPSLGISLVLAAALDRMRPPIRSALTALILACFAVGLVVSVWPYREELALWERALERAPTNRKARINWTSELVYRGRLVDAERGLRDGIALDPGYGSFHRALADVLSLQGRQADAVAEAREGATLEPANGQVMLTYAGLLYDTGSEAEAANVYRAITTAFPEAGEPWWYLSRMAEHGGDLAAATSAMREALKRYPVESSWAQKARTELARLESLTANGDGATSP